MPGWVIGPKLSTAIDWPVFRLFLLLQTRHAREISESGRVLSSKWQCDWMILDLCEFQIVELLEAPCHIDLLFHEDHIVSAWFRVWDNGVSWCGSQDHITGGNWYHKKRRGKVVLWGAGSPFIDTTQVESRKADSTVLILNSGVRQFV